MLDDLETYKHLYINPSASKAKDVDKFFNNLPETKKITKETSFRLKASDATTPAVRTTEIAQKKDSLRPIVSFTDLPTYDLAKELSSLQKPLIGKSKHQVKNSSDFASSSITNELLQTDEIMVSFDVVSLFRNRSNSLDIKHVQTTPAIRS